MVLMIPDKVVTAMQARKLFKDDATIANRYLADQLSDAERAEFESALIEDPDVVRELEATARLKVGLQRLRETGELRPLLEPAPFYRQPVWLAAAASIAVAAIGLTLVRLDLTTPETTLAASATALVDSTGHALSVGSTHPIFRARAENYDAEITLPATPQAIELHVLPEVVSSTASYRVALLRVGDDRTTEPVAEVSGLQPTADGFLTVFADSTRLRPGRYQLTVVGEGIQDAPLGVGTFLIRVK